MTTFLISLAVCCALAPVARWFALRAGILDIPNHRSSHTRPTPRVGGLACAAGVVVAIVASSLSGQPFPWWVMAGALTMATVGLADDRSHISTLLRLGLQVAVGLICGFAMGGPWLAAVGAIAVPVVVNAVNFMDGINAISSLSVLVWGASAYFAGAAGSSGEVQVLGAAAAGAALGFLPWNAPTARLFLGDVGSYFFGGLVALGIVLGIDAGIAISLLVAPLAVYAADTGFTLVRRASRGEPLLEAHRSHVYQRLTNELGIPHLAGAAIVAGTAGAVVLSWWWLSSPAAVVASIVMLSAYLVSPVLLGRIRHGRKATR